MSLAPDLHTKAHALRGATLRAAWCVLLCALAGCQLFHPTPAATGKSPLVPFAANDNQTVLEVFFVRLPPGQEESLKKLWQDVDEQSLPAEARRKLSRNGFRAGVIGSHIPPQITAALEKATAPNAPGKLAVTESPDQPGATRHEMLLQTRQRGELITSGVLPEFHVLEWSEGRPRGATFQNGQAEFGVISEPAGGGHVKLELTPELHYGDYRQRYVSGEGMFRLDNSRKKKVFDDLKLTATLAPGEVLLLAARPERPGSLGDRFFRESDTTAPRPRLLLLRLSPNPHDAAFSGEATGNAAEPDAAR
ncbi:MAG: hypothetical protein K8T25_20510 [Planctomycetia bacterium]|nr:hypothetical protein [Planctomycetia bacterium]